MASISITNVSVNYTGDTFQGKVDFDLTCTPTEVRLNVGFKINLDTQLNFDAIDYGSKELIEWCNKYLANVPSFFLTDTIAELIRDNPKIYSVSGEVMDYLKYNNTHEFDDLLEKVTPVNYYKAMVKHYGFTWQEKVQFLNVIVAYPEQQTISSHSVEFSVPKESLINYNSPFETVDTETGAEFFALARHQLDVWLSAELDWGNANTQGRFAYNLAL